MSHPIPPGGIPMYSQEALMIKYANSMREYAQFFWIGICLSWLFGIPLLILFIKYIKMIQFLGEISKSSTDIELNKGYQSLVIGLVLGIIGFLMIIVNWILSLFAAILVFCFTVWGQNKLENWAINLHKKKPNSNTGTFVMSMGEYKTAIILSPIGIGIFLLPGAIQRASNALFLEYNMITTSSSQNQPSPIPNPIINSQVNPQIIDNTIMIKQNPPVMNIPTKENNYKHCTNCGVQLPINAKFCFKCGEKLNY